MKTKKDKTYSFNHFQERLLERYDLEITESEYNVLCLVNTLDIPISTEYQKNDTQKIYDVLFKEKMIRVVYSEARNLLTTVLPK
jgi:transcriptional regulator